MSDPERMAYSAHANRPPVWLLSRVLFDLIPLRLIPTIIVKWAHSQEDDTESC